MAASQLPRLLGALLLVALAAASLVPSSSDEWHEDSFADEGVGRLTERQISGGGGSDPNSQPCVDTKDRVEPKDGQAGQAGSYGGKPCTQGAPSGGWDADGWGSQ